MTSKNELIRLVIGPGNLELQQSRHWKSERSNEADATVSKLNKNSEMVSTSFKVLFLLMSTFKLGRFPNKLNPMSTEYILKNSSQMLSVTSDHLYYMYNSNKNA